ncbi:MAG: hypothetical protein OES13_05005 [Acidimicrobiia bacterium]|nr:hypothetical protein [Acidimicrobiia bacterium]
MRTLEAAAVGAVGAGLGAAVGTPFDLTVAGAIIGGLNGLGAGATGIYDWRSPKGPLGLVLDSTWGLPLVTAALGLHIANFVLPNSDYRRDLSERAGYHVYGGGVYARRGFVWTVGNVVSNARPDDARRLKMLARHEGLHVWQHRILGPLYPLLYLVWMAAGGLAGTAVWAFRRGSWWKTVETIAYYDNPFETWAYRRDERWPHPSADRSLSWGGSHNQSVD